MSINIVNEIFGFKPDELNHLDTWRVNLSRT